MVEHAPSVFEAGDQLAKITNGTRDMDGFDDDFEENGFSYGAEPVCIVHEDVRQAYATPAPKRDKDGKRIKDKDREVKERKSTDKKRKRHHVEELDLSAARPSSHERDEIMEDAPPVLHSGLTGGLTRLLSNSEFPPSPDYSGGDGAGFEASPLSPLKRTRTTIGNGKARTRTTSALVRTRKISSSTRTSDESRPRKHHRKHHHHHHDVLLETPSRTLKAIGYHAPDADDSQQQLVVYRTRAEHFLSFVQKGPDSEHGCSINKALKRYHRERGEQGLGLGKAEEEKELWKSLRLRKNERGEVVVFFS